MKRPVPTVQQRLDVGNRAGAADTAKILSFTCIPVSLIRHCLLHHFAQLITSLYPQETICLAYLSFAESMQCLSDIHSFICYCRMDEFMQSQWLAQHKWDLKQSSYWISSPQRNLAAWLQQHKRMKSEVRFNYTAIQNINYNLKV